jgi:hypothetical protein|tara:strand:- start:714 stop:977 length:264 start_codon:yes stop_codon:yes gene_type:complete
MESEGMPMTMAVDPAACEAATAMITDAGIDPRELAELVMSAGPESDPMPKLADAHFDGDIEAAIALMDGLSQTDTDPVRCGHIEPPL